MYLGYDTYGEKLVLDANDLLTHAVILGRTGSGKTGLTIALLEEIASAGISAIVIDPKGDLTNLALPLLSKEDFARWTEDPEEARLRHGDGLAEFDLGFEHVRWWRDVVDVKVYTPGDTNGLPVNIFPDFNISTLKEQALRNVQTVVKAIGHHDASASPSVVYLAEAVRSAWAHGRALPISDWPGILTNPPDELRSFGGMKLEDFFPKRLRLALAKSIVVFQHESDRWLSGPNIDLHWMAEIADKPQIAIFSLRHLNEEDRQLFTSVLLRKLVDFMFETGASKQLKLAAVLDEARGYLPPHPHNPATKEPLGTILAQGRAHGIGMIIGTQNPMDLDYKALSNVGTWFIGRLRARDCNRDLAAELSNRDVEIERVLSLPQRRFLTLDKNGKNHLLNVRWCYNHLRGPLSNQELVNLS